ncbi:MAG: ABC transporter ATP-binding protein [Thermoplasmataceae archaeon]|jgi:multiple sugar transport system ATP-binding protein
MAEVRLEKVTKNFGKGKGVFNISMQVEDGEFFVLLGPSGCGKTTTLRIIAGLELLDSGKIYLGRNEITDFPPKDRDMAMVFQNYALYPFLTVAGNLAFPLKKRKVPKSQIESKIEEVAKVLGISDLLDRKPGQISGGQRQRVALGRALVREPSVFLMDEPLSNLDAKLRTSMRGELKRIQKSFATTTIYVTHDQVEAMTLADRVAVLNNGLMIQLDSPLKIYDMPRNSFVAAFLGDPQMNMVPAELVNDDGEFKVKVSNNELDLSLTGIKVPSGTKSVDVNLGFRPEDVMITEKGLNAKVLVIQNLGRSRIEHLQLIDSGKEIIRIGGPDSPLSVGEMVSIMPNESKFYLFDQNTLDRLWPSQP